MINSILNRHYLLIEAYEFNYKLCKVGMILMFLMLIVFNNPYFFIGFGALGVIYFIFRLLYNKEVKKLLEFIKEIKKIYDV